MGFPARACLTRCLRGREKRVVVEVRVAHFQHFPANVSWRDPSPRGG